MKKITNKKYEAIIQAKNIISQLCEDGAMDYVESGVDKISRRMLVTLITHRLRRIRYQISIVMS